MNNGIHVFSWIRLCVDVEYEPSNAFIHTLFTAQDASTQYISPQLCVQRISNACLSVIYVSYVIYWWFRITFNRTKLIMHIWTDTFFSWKHMHQCYASSHGTESITLLFIIKNWFFEYFKFSNQRFQVG